MPVMPIVLNPDPILRLVTEPVTVFDSELARLARDMFETMAHHNGVGLAAPQVGILRRLIVVSYKNKRFALVNPEITFLDEPLALGDEGCLSIPGIRVSVPRATKVEVRGNTLAGKSVKMKESGYVARILQHEIDHLNGILILDKGTPIPDEDVL
ncbi:peptide deformylase [bacterium]|nr:peptide deformylase [bacterium]